MKYKVVEVCYKVDLEREVNKLLKEGWKTLGGVCYNGGFGHGITYAQAMLLEDKE